jgi:hypothetical protein
MEFTIKKKTLQETKQTRILSRSQLLPDEKVQAAHVYFEK